MHREIERIQSNTIKGQSDDTDTMRDRQRDRHEERKRNRETLSWSSVLTSCRARRNDGPCATHTSRIWSNDVHETV